MSGLLVKLRGNGKDTADVSLLSDRPTDDNAADPEPASDSVDGLAMTQSGDVLPLNPMTFTYAPGDTPLPRYTIRRGVGIGGFGEVYFAVNEAGKEVALKRIQRNLDVELRGVSHCLNLKHPNLVSLYDICRDEQDQSWVVMEYVAGPNLRQVLDQSPQGLPIEEARRWFGAIAAGVSHLHSAGLVHRDLKPGNVFDDLGIVKVGDYGLSKFISASHRGGHTESVGTFHYMAPEIGRGEYGREIDVYAMGIMLYELLTGRVPFDGESCHEIIVKHLTATPDVSGIDEPYRSVITRSLEKDPGKRFATVPDMMEALGFDTAAALQGVVKPQVVLTSRSKPDVQSPKPAAPEIESPVDAKVIDPPASAPRNPQTDEPVLRAIKASFEDLRRWWRTLDQSPGAKTFIAIVAVFVLMLNAHLLLPLLSVIGLFYVPYYVIRQMVLHVRQQPTYAQAQRIAIARGAPKPRRMTRTQWCNHMRTELRAKRSIHRAAELNTSWVAAIFTTTGLGLAAAMIGLQGHQLDPMSIAPYGWVASLVLAGSLGILALGKLWEREDGEALPRRMVLAGLGAGLGILAYAGQRYLMMPVDQGLSREVDAISLPPLFYDNGVPVDGGAMMAHFAVLFALVRWWRPVDPLRRRRLSVWYVAMAVAAEWIVHQVLPIPQPAGYMIAGGTAIVIQMSAPWINRRSSDRPAPNPGSSDPQPTSPSGARSIA